MIAHLRLEIEKLRRALYGVRSERKARLLEQMELQLEELETAASEDELLAKKAAARTHGAPPSQRKRPSRKPFPEHLPRERVVIPAPACCPSCGSTKLSKLGEDVTETLEVSTPLESHPDGAREVLLRACETIAQPPAPFHATPRGFAGPNLLAMILSRSSASISLSTGRASAMRVRASIFPSRRWPTRSAPVPRRCNRFMR